MEVKDSARLCAEKITDASKGEGASPNSVTHTAWVREPPLSARSLLALLA